jgi:branched-chain amino acid transport system substrate-binding protein
VVALAMTHVTAEKRKLHILTGGHTNEITRSQCSWNVFPEYKANAIADTPAFRLSGEPLPASMSG